MKVVRQVRDVQLGDHLCLAFSHEAEQREVASAFVMDGLEGGERVLYLADGPGERVHRWLRDAGADVAGTTARGQLGVRPAEGSYLASGRFDADAMIAVLEGEVAASLAAGFTGLRVSGEMNWALLDVPGAEQLEDYERRVTTLFAEGLSAAMCQYDARRFPAARLATLAGCHLGNVRMNALFSDGPLRITSTFDSTGGRLLRVSGAVDYGNTAALRAALETAAAWQGDVRLDMAEMEFIDVAGLRELVQAAYRLPAGRRLQLSNLTPAMDRVIRLVGWDQTPRLVLGLKGTFA